MKYLFIIFLFLGFTQLNAGSITDNANILGLRLEELSAKIAPLPIFIESHETLSDPRAYADERVKELTSKGFLIIVTTNPRKWRISMTPERVTSGEQTRLIGDRMMSYFKGGDYYSGLLLAATELNKLIDKGPAVEKIEDKIETNQNMVMIISITAGVLFVVIFSYVIHRWINKPIARVRSTKEKPLYGQIEPKKESVKFDNGWSAQTGTFSPLSNKQPIFVTGEYFAPTSGLMISGEYWGDKYKTSQKQYYCPPSVNNHSYSDNGPDLITPLIVYSALSNSDDDRPKSSPSTDYSSYDSSSSSNYDSSSSSSDSGGSSGGDW